MNRRLVGILVLEGAVVGGATGLLFVVTNPSVAYGLATLGAAAMLAVPFQYLCFLGDTLQTPLVAPFRSRSVCRGLTLASGLVFALVLLYPEAVIGHLYSPDWASWNFRFSWLGQRGNQLYGLTSIFGLAAALSAYGRTRPGTCARSQAKWFVIAFGVRDVYVGVAHLLYPVLRPVPHWGDGLYNLGQGLVCMAFVLLLAYGVLRTQLFDIDVRIRSVLEQGTVGAAIAGGFLLGSEILESIIPVQGNVLGVAVALGVVAALRPIQRIAERIVGTLLPGVKVTADQLEARKLEVYRAALEGALQDGRITERERDILGRLREELGIAPAEAVAEEEAVRDAAAGAVPADGPSADPACDTC
jgi:hypothetical protein